MCQMASKLLRIHLFFFSFSKTKLLIFRAACCPHSCLCNFCWLLLAWDNRPLIELTFHVKVTIYRTLCPKVCSSTALISETDITEWTNCLFLVTRCGIKHSLFAYACQNVSFFIMNDLITHGNWFFWVVRGIIMFQILLAKRCYLLGKS